MPDGQTIYPWRSVTGRSFRPKQAPRPELIETLRMVLAVSDRLAELWGLTRGYSHLLLAKDFEKIVSETASQVRKALDAHGDVAGSIWLSQACDGLVKGLEQVRGINEWQDTGPMLWRYRNVIRKNLRMEFSGLQGSNSIWEEEECNLILECLLREALICRRDLAFGPCLLPLILWSYPKPAKFCRAQRIDQGHLHRVIAGHASLSMKRLRSALESFTQAGSEKGDGVERADGPDRRRGHYELHFVKAAEFDRQVSGSPLGEWMERSRPPGGFGGTEGEAVETEGKKIEEACREEYSRIVGGGGSQLLDRYDRSYVLRVLRGDAPGSYRFFALLAICGDGGECVIIPKWVASGPLESSLVVSHSIPS